MSKGLKIIVVTGPESSGKSYLAKLLAEKFQLPMVSEYAREYIDGLYRVYEEQDLIEIAKGQYDQLKELEVRENSWIIMDTDFLTIKIWGLEKYNWSPEILEELSTSFPTRHYLCCRPDIPWEYDPQRENPVDRARLFELYLSELQSLDYPYDIIEGSYGVRTALAMNATASLLKI